MTAQSGGPDRLGSAKALPLRPYLITSQTVRAELVVE